MFVIMLRGLGVESFTVYHNSDFYTCTCSMTCKSANTNFDYDIIISYVDGTYHDYLCIEFMKFICDGVPWGYSIVRSWYNYVIVNKDFLSLNEKRKLHLILSQTRKRNKIY